MHCGPATAVAQRIEFGLHWLHSKPQTDNTTLLLSMRAPIETISYPIKGWHPDWVPVLFTHILLGYCKTVTKQGAKV